ncbi:hypothetical protein OAL49_03600 [Gammaproteobacteria bacterium]|nr:hypothetical protein [Gammaproteobacteria bacterium]
MKWLLTSNIALVTFLLMGCTTEFGSFQSSQLTFVRDQLRSNIDRGPRPEWVIHWLGEKRPVYAVNAGSQVLFANESGDLLRFYDNQIVEARNLLPGEKIVLIDKEMTNLHYRVNGSSIGVHACLVWQVEQLMTSSPGTSYVQKCSHGETDYANRVAVNRTRELVRLIYYVHPAYPPVRIELGKE